MDYQVTITVSLPLPGQVLGRFGSAEEALAYLRGESPDDLAENLIQDAMGDWEISFALEEVLPSGHTKEVATFSGAEIPATLDEALADC